MISLGKIEGGLGAAGMVKHLMNSTVSVEESRLAAYYGRAVQHDDLMLQVSHAVASGEITYAEGCEELIRDWEIRNPEPTTAEIKERFPYGIPPDAPDPYDEWRWQRYEAEGRLMHRLDVLQDRITGGLLDAPIATVRPDISPRVALALGIEPDGILSNKEIDHLLSGLRADGQPVEGKSYAKKRSLPPDKKTGKERSSRPLGSLDHTFSPHKSVSVAWAFANNIEKAMILNAHTEAAREAMAYISTQIGQARIGEGGKDGAIQGDIAWLEFTHHTARAVKMVMKDGNATFEDAQGIKPDPDLHTHFLVHNSVHCPDGRVGSLDTATLRGFILEADALYNARYGQRLRDAGFDVVRDERTNSARMLAIPEQVAAHYSKRTNAGEVYAKIKALKDGIDWDALSSSERSQRISNATQDQSQKAKGGRDGLADFADWQRQAEEIGWKPPTSLQAQMPLLLLRSAEVIRREAYETALTVLEPILEQRSVLSGWEVRAAAGQGLIHAGAPFGRADIDAVVKIMASNGVRQYGQATALRWGLEVDGRQTSVTTALHEADEREFIALAKAASSDRSSDLSQTAINQAIARSGRKFTAEQLDMINALGRSGRLSVGIGAAGSGKSTQLGVLVDAFAHAGDRDVWGASLAWRQADALADAGISPHRVKAFSVLIDSIKSGDTKLTRHSVVVVDELGLLGTRQGLELLRLQKRHGFQIIALGDEKQIKSISAGSIFSLLRQSLPNIPELNTTIRQKSDREKKIAGMLRNDQPIEALKLKIEDGTARLVEGGIEGVVAATAKQYREQLQATGKTPLVMTVTNDDTRTISLAIREERRSLGLLGPDIRTIKATDGERTYPLALAIGDKVRLFKSVGADYGGGKGGPIGRNGKVLDVVDVHDTTITLRSEAGRVGRVAWDKLKDKNTGRYLLSYGDAATIHTSQGRTTKAGLLALLRGSKELQGGMGYSGLTRHEMSMDLLTSRSAEFSEVLAGRAKNDIRPVSDDECWSAVAQHLLEGKAKDLSTSMMDRVTNLRHGTVQTFHQSLVTPYARQSVGQAPTDAPTKRLHRHAAPKSMDIWAAAIAKAPTAFREHAQRLSHRLGPTRTL